MSIRYKYPTGPPRGAARICRDYGHTWPERPTWRTFLIGAVG